MTNKEPTPNHLYTAIAQVIQQARQQVRQVINQQMVQAYWEIGRLIVEQEQQGQKRAEYGKQQLKHLSKQLQSEFGKGFDVGNLRNMRQFYLTFPKHYTACSVLSWSHYRTLMRIENPAARQWYADEAAAQNWSVQFNSIWIACMEESGDDPPFIVHALNSIASARNMNQLARKVD